MAVNEKIEIILALREFSPEVSLVVEPGISPVVIRLNGVCTGGSGYMLSVAGHADTFEEALDNVFNRISGSWDYVIIEAPSNTKLTAIGLRLVDKTWITVKEYSNETLHSS